MSASGELLIGLVMVVGLVGVVLPVLPGLLLIWGAGALWCWLDGGGAVRWTVLVVLTLLLVAGTTAKYVLPARRASGAGAPPLTLLVGAAGAVAGFFLIPVVGLVIGGVAGIFAGELARLRDLRVAWRSTAAVLVGIGIGMLVEMTAGLAMVAVWAAAVLAT